MANDDKTTLGRTYDQVTKDGSSSAATLGTGGTGGAGGISGEGAAGKAPQADGGNVQPARTDDLLSDGSDDEGSGFVGQGPGETGEVQTGMAGIGSLNPGKPGNK